MTDGSFETRILGGSATPMDGDISQYTQLSDLMWSLSDFCK